MIISKKSFQSIKISNEISDSNIIPNVIDFIKKINEKLNFNINEDMIVSVKYGKRILINCEKSNLKEIEIDDFIEIADYNPIKKIFLTIGKHNPDFNMTLHWIILNAHREKNILVQLKSNFIDNKLNKNKHVDEKKIKENSIELSKDILYKLRDSNSVYQEKYGIFIIGNNINEIEKLINNMIEGNS